MKSFYSMGEFTSIFQLLHASYNSIRYSFPLIIVLLQLTAVHLCVCILYMFEHKSVDGFLSLFHLTLILWISVSIENIWINFIS